MNSGSDCANTRADVRLIVADVRKRLYDIKQRTAQYAEFVGGSWPSDPEAEKLAAYSLLDEVIELNRVAETIQELHRQVGA